jgi:hypothetical protein
MKATIKTTMLLSFLLVIIIYGCKKDSTDSHFNEPFEIKVGDDIEISPLSKSSASDGSITFEFQKVTQDSRCFKSSACNLCLGNWATIQVHLITSNTAVDLSLSIPGCIDEYLCNDNSYYKVDTLGYRICFLRLDPYPDIHDLIDYSDYTAKINIAKMHI